MNEQTQEPILRLCYLLIRRQESELAYRRANYKVSYYRKLKSKLEKENNSSPEWKAKNFELATKIEKARLVALKKHRDWIQVKQKLAGPINRAIKKSNAKLIFTNSYSIASISIYESLGFLAKQLYMITASKIEEYADQYEASKALDKVLSNDEAH